MKPHELKLTKKLKNDFAKAEKISSSFQLYSNLPDPDLILSENNNDYGILRDLLRDAHLSAVVQQRKSFVEQLGWEITCEGDKKTELAVVGWLQKLDVGEKIESILDAVLYGYAVLEINWAVGDEVIYPVRIAQKPQEWFIFDRNNVLKMRQKDVFGYIFAEGVSLPLNKFIVVQNNSSYMNPYGEKNLSKCYWPVHLKRSGLDFWQIMVERYGMPFLIGRYGALATEADKTALLDGLRDMVTDNIAIFPDTTIIELKEHPKFEIGQLYQYLAEFYNAEMSKAILTETLTTEIKNQGSYAAANVHRETAATVAMKDKKMVESFFNRLLSIYSDLNFSDKRVIRFRLTKKESLDAENIDRDIKLQDLGIEFTKDYFRRKYNLNADDFDIRK